MLEVLRPAINDVARLPKERRGMNSLRQLLDDQHGQYGKELADELKHESSKLYMPVCMLLNRVSVLLANHV